MWCTVNAELTYGKRGYYTNVITRLLNLLKYCVKTFQGRSNLPGLDAGYFPLNRLSTPLRLRGLALTCVAFLNSGIRLRLARTGLYDQLPSLSDILREGLPAYIPGSVIFSVTTLTAPIITLEAMLTP